MKRLGNLRDLDESMLRRFEKQMYVAPPDEKTRELLLESYLPKVISENPKIEANVDFHYVAQVNNQYLLHVNLPNMNSCFLRNSVDEKLFGLRYKEHV